MIPFPEPFRKIIAATNLKIEALYATENNFTQKPLPGYHQNNLWLHHDAYERFQEVMQTVTKLELGLIVWDAYRPHRATKAMIAWAKETKQLHLVEDG